MLNPIEDDRFETERLVLRPPAFSDAAGLMEMLNDPAICRFSPHKVITDVARMHFAIVDWHERREQGLRTYVINLRDRVRDPIGLYHLHASGEVGGGVSPRHDGRGIALEALLALRRSAVGLMMTYLRETTPYYTSALSDDEMRELIRRYEASGQRVSLTHERSQSVWCFLMISSQDRFEHLPKVRAYLQHGPGDPDENLETLLGQMVRLAATHREIV